MDSQWTQAGRWAQHNAFWDNVAPRLKPIERDVWLAMFRHAYPDGETIATRRRVSQMLGSTEGHVGRAIRGLKAAGLLRRNNGKVGYYLLLPDDLNVDHICTTSEAQKSQSVDHICTTGGSPMHPQWIAHAPPVDHICTTSGSPMHPITEDIHTEDTEETQSKEAPARKPKQGTLTGTGKRESWQDRAKRLKFWDFKNAYPNVADKAAAYKNFLLWEVAVKEEGGAEVQTRLALEWLEKIKVSAQWTDEGGRYIPSMRRCIEERRWRVPIVERQKTRKELLIEKNMEAHNFDEL